VTDYKLKVTLKYCGSCNPLIDLIQIGNKLKEAIENAPELQLVSPDDDHIDVVVILCGAKNFIVTAGEMVDLVPVSEKDMPAEILKKVKSFSSPKS